MNLQNKTVTVKGTTYQVQDLVRKTYAVEESADEILWEQIGRYDNSTEANAALDKARAGAPYVRLVVVGVSNQPKKLFWDLWRQDKAAFKAAGIFVTKENGNFVVTDNKVTRRDIIRAKGYGWSEYNEGLRNGDPEADYILKAKCNGEFDSLEAEGYGAVITAADRRIAAEHEKRENSAS